MRFPPELLKQIADFCTENKIGVAHLYQSEADVTIILAGPKDYHPDQISIVAAHMLLTGVVSNAVKITNEIQESTNLPKDKVN